MASTTQGAHLPALGTHEREEAGNQLQATMAELVDLALLGKHLHWNVTGPLFRPLHEQLDEFVDSWRELSDVVAERAVALGYSPDGQSGAIAGATEHKALERGALSDDVVVRELSERLNYCADRARERMERLGEIDSASEDVLIEVVRALEQQLWMIRVQFSHARAS